MTVARGAVRIVMLGVVLTALVAGVGCFRRNLDPVAFFSRTPGYGEAPLRVEFDATGSFDPDGALVSYSWEFGDGATAVGSLVTRSFHQTGDHEVRLTVTDDRGAVAQYVRMVSVVDPGSLPPQGAEVGQTALDFTLEDLEGTPVTLSDLRGLVVLIDFWASWCPPCRDSMPHLEALRAAYEDEGLIVVAVSQDETWADVSGFADANGLDTMIVLWGSYSEARAVRDAYDVVGIPHTFVIDRQGIIRHRDHPIRIRARHIEPWL